MQTMFTPNIIFIKHSELKEMDEKLLGRSAFRYCPEKHEIKRKFTFFSVNTKNISSHVLKISLISLVLYTRENADIFETFDEIYLVFTSKK